MVSAVCASWTRGVAWSRTSSGRRALARVGSSARTKGASVGRVAGVSVAGEGLDGAAGARST